MEYNFDINNREHGKKIINILSSNNIDSITNVVSNWNNNDCAFNLLKVIIDINVDYNIISELSEKVSKLSENINDDVCEIIHNNVSIKEEKNIYDVLINKYLTDINYCYNKITLLVLSMREKNTVLFEALLEYYIKKGISYANKKCDIFGNMLMQEVKTTSRFFLEKLIKNNIININTEDKFGHTILNYCIKFGIYSIFSEFISYDNINNYDITKYDYFGDAPLHKCLMYNNLEFLKIISRHKNFDINIRNNIDGSHALHIVCNNNNNNLFEELLKYPYIDLNIPDKNGITCFPKILLDYKYRININKLLTHPNFNLSHEIDSWSNSKLKKLPFYTNCVSQSNRYARIPKMGLFFMKIANKVDNGSITRLIYRDFTINDFGKLFHSNLLSENEDPIINRANYYDTIYENVNYFVKVLNIALPTESFKKIRFGLVGNEFLIVYNLIENLSYIIKYSNNMASGTGIERILIGQYLCACLELAALIINQYIIKNEQLIALMNAIIRTISLKETSSGLNCFLPNKTRLFCHFLKHLKIGSTVIFYGILDKFDASAQNKIIKESSNNLLKILLVPKFYNITHTIPLPIMENILWFCGHNVKTNNVICN